MSHNVPLTFMALPEEIRFITISVYGTLIDVDTGVYEAFCKEAARDNFTMIPKEELLPLFYEVRQEMQLKSYELYSEVLRRTVVEVAKQIDWEIDSSRSKFLPDSIPYWKPFKDSHKELQRLRKKFPVGFLSNIDDKLLGMSRRHMPMDLDLVITAQQVRSYKPEPAHFKECSRRIGGKKNWIHISDNPYYDIAPAMKQRIPTVWINKTKAPYPGKKQPDLEVKNLREAVKILLTKELAPAKKSR